MPCSTSEQSVQLGRIMLEMKDNPVSFNQAVLGRAPYWRRQIEVAEAIVAHKSVIVATGNAVGKSYLAAGLALWWLFTRLGSLVVATAPSQALLGTVLFKEIRLALESSRRSGLSLPGRVTDSPRASPQVVEIEPGWGMLGISTRGVERLSGQHNPNLLAIVDEASGVEPEIWEALFSLNPSKMVVFGNPLAAGTQFHKLFLQGEAETRAGTVAAADRTVAIRIPSADSPDIGLDRSPRGLADRGFLLEAERQWSRGSPLWNSHVEGVFPTAIAQSLLESPWIDRCRAIGREARSRSADPQSVILAIDPAAGVGADRTALLVRDRLGILEIQASTRMTLAHAALEIDRLARKYRVPQHRIIYDASGLGRDLPNELRPYRIIEAQPYQGAASGGHKFVNMRSRCAWRLRHRLDPSRRIFAEAEPDQDYEGALLSAEYERYRLPWIGKPAEPSPPASRMQEPFTVAPAVEHWESLREELAELRYCVKGLRIALEDKTLLQRRLGRSPDLADALLMSFALE